MNRYKVKIDPQALIDITEIVSWYNRQQSGLAQRFQNLTVKQINTLGKNSNKYAIRYKEIRCLLIPKFPYMVHYYVNNDSNTVEILAVISTSRNPKI